MNRGSRAIFLKIRKGEIATLESNACIKDYVSEFLRQISGLLGARVHSLTNAYRKSGHWDESALNEIRDEAMETSAIKSRIVRLVPFARVSVRLFGEGIP